MKTIVGFFMVAATILGLAGLGTVLVLQGHPLAAITPFGMSMLLMLSVKIKA